MLTFGAEQIPRKGNKKAKMHKYILFSFSLLPIFFSCKPAAELQEEFRLSPGREFSMNLNDTNYSFSNPYDAYDSNATNHAAIRLFSNDSASAELFYLSLNELLFDPLPQSCDYVEIVNRSSYPVDLAEISICNRNEQGVLASPKPLSRNRFILEAGAYCVLTSDLESLGKGFLLDTGLNCLIIKSLPSMPNDKGCVVLLDRQGNIIDECPYTKYMHHCLISDKEGVALEKIHPDLPSAEANSWLSAAADASYGTPGRINSQYRPLDAADTKEGFFVEQDRLSPLGDSKYKQLVLRYAFAHQRVANIGIFNRSGALLYPLAKNALLGTRGFFVWQGVDSKGKVPDAGSYLIHIEHFNLEGDSKKQDIVCRILP